MALPLPADGVLPGQTGGPTKALCSKKSACSYIGRPETKVGGVWLQHWGLDSIVNMIYSVRLGLYCGGTSARGKL